MTVASDDFSAGTLDSMWVAAGPDGTTVRLAADADDGFLELVTPDGNHDVWGTNNAARAMQAVADEDLQIEVGFLSTPSQKYQMQGLLVEADAGNWLRFDTYFDGSALRAFGAVTVNGVSTAKFNVVVAGGEAPQLRLTRGGDTWTLEYSIDGDAWTTAGSFDHALTVAQVGVFAGNAGPATGYVAQVDYFESASDPIADEDGTIAPVNQPPVAVDDAVTAETDTALTIDIAHDLLGNDSDGDGDPLSLAGFTQPDHGSLSDNGDGTLTYTPAPGYSGPDSFSYTVSDGSLSDSASVSIAVQAPPPPSVAIHADDFSDGVLDGAWQIAGPAGTQVRLATSASDAFLELVTPDGSHDAWGANNAARAMQAVADGNFQVEAAFLSTPNQKYQMQGILVEADTQNWLRFDIFFDGSKLRAFAAVTVDGTSASRVNAVIADGQARILRVTRDGDAWTVQHSNDGDVWTTAGSFEHALAVTQVGVFAGNTGPATGFVGQVDYFQSAADPIVDEDAEITPINAPPDAVDDSFDTGRDESLLIDVAEDLLGNDSDGNGDPLSLTGFTQPTHGSLADNGDGTLTYAPAAGYEGPDSFSYTVSDGSLSDTATVEIAVLGPPPPDAGARSDDFSDGALDPMWLAAGPAGTQVRLSTNAEHGFLELVTPDGNHDVWGTNNAARAMQAVADGNLQLEVGFLSTPSQKYQMQGILAQADADNWLRFDTYFDGSKLRAFAAATIDGSSSARLNVVVAGGQAPVLRVTRDGDTWTLQHSVDGEAWVTAGSFTQVLAVSQVGVFGGNTGSATGYVAQVDYVASASDPLLDEDADITPVNVAPVAADDALATDADAAFVIVVASDLLGNDSDGNGDPLSLTGFTQPGHGSLLDNGDGTLTYTPVSDFNGLDSFAYTVSDGSLTDSATVQIAVGNPVTVWYGLEQSFGAPGAAQHWVNVLGNVAGSVAALSYTLNDGPEQALEIGPDTRRLQNPGDFNIELPYAALDGSITDDVVRITAVMDSGQVATRDVVLNYQAGATWDADYDIHWGAAASLQDVAQVVDGKWAVIDGAVRPVELGYDRLLAIGDASWDNYELRLGLTAHDLFNVDPRGRDGGGFALGMLWNGHTDDPIAGWDPHVGWEPGAAFFFTNRDGIGKLQLHPSEDFFNILGSRYVDLVEGESYELVMRVEQSGLYDRTYSLKLWDAGAPEPTGWTLQGTETFGLERAPATGSLLLNAHYFDVGFHDLSVQEIPGADIVKGGAGVDLLAAVDATAALPGLGEIDVFEGRAGADTFVFGENGVAYYDDGQPDTDGTADYAFVWDFEPGSDRVLLAGTAADYVLVDDADGLPPGTAIYRAAAGASDELVGLLHDSYGLSLASGDFLFEASA